MTLRLLLLTGMICAVPGCGDKATNSAGAENEGAANEEPAVAGQTATVAPAALPRTASVDGARVFFITPKNGDTVSNPIKVEFGIEGMSVVKAGDNQPNSGHHHLLIDSDLPDLGLPIPNDERRIHFGDGSTTTQITLDPGQHTLQMLLGDYLHIPHDPPLLSEVVTVTVE